MAEHLLLVFSNARPELEDEFNEWYTNVHMVVVVDKIAGIEAGQRFQLAGTYRDAPADFKYLAMYWIPEGRLDDARAGLRWQREEREEALAAGGTPAVPMFDAFEGEVSALFFTSVSEKYTGPA
jgi:hypothetical protein